jgi:methionyl-tRNA formyltransferase
MRLVFAGTPEFSVPALEALIAAGHEVCAVFTQPDRPAGRGRKLSATPVAARAEALGIPVHKPEKLTEPDHETLRALAPDVMVVVAYGLILRQVVLDIPHLGCINIHASLLPRWRGAAPIARAIEAGDTETGITIMRMDKGLDTGPMLLMEPVAILPTTTAAILHDQLSALGGRLIAAALAQLEHGALPEQPQPAEGATYAKKLTKEEAQINWTLPAMPIAQRIRAFNPAPGAWSTLDGERIRLLNAIALAPRADLPAPGTLVAASADGYDVATGEGLVRITELQRPGGRALLARDAMRAWAPVGSRFEAPMSESATATGDLH